MRKEKKMERIKERQMTSEGGDRMLEPRDVIASEVQRVTWRALAECSWR